MDTLGFPGGSEVKASAWNAGDPSSIPGLGRSPGEGNGNLLHYSCLEMPWTEEPGRLKSIGSKESDTTEQLSVHHVNLGPLFSLIQMTVSTSCSCHIVKMDNSKYKT